MGAKTKRTKRAQYGIAGVKKKVGPLVDTISTGELLCIDPSIISSSSVPGWAVYSKGKLKESGTISGIDPRCSVAERLQFLGKALRMEFDNPDVLAIEHIENHGGHIGRALTPTVRATGAFIAAFDCPVISMVPLVWIRYVPMELNGKTPTQKHKDYKARFKSDALDAEMIGHAIIKIMEELDE